MRFSKITNGFYPRSVDYKNLPTDIIDITQDEYALALPISPEKRAIINGKLVIIADTADELLVIAKTTQISLLDKSCADEIILGFTSSALGAIYKYPSKPNDQTNLVGSVSSGLAEIDFWCMDEAGLWALRTHTLTQITQVLADAATLRIGYSVKLAGLISEISAMTDISEIELVVW